MTELRPDLSTAAPPAVADPVVDGPPLTSVETPPAVVVEPSGWKYTVPGGLLVCIGDVSGKGVPAGLVMASARSALRSIYLVTSTACRRLRQRPIRLSTPVQS